MGRLAGRLRRQASSHNWTECIRKRWVGWQAAFAGKPRSHNWTECIRKIWVGWQAAFASKLAPTIGLSASERDRSAGRPPSQASQLPQLDRVHPGAIGRLSGRLRGQASLLQKQNQKQSGIHRTAPHHSLGRALARLLLILLYPPLREAEWRCSSGGWARSAVRRSRTHREEVVAKQTVGDAPR